jgi:GDPmannose 4,6-dehydratase
MFTCNGILFNHESPLRGETFVTRKITRGIAQMAMGIQDTLYMGNIDSQRDWGHAKDYVEAMWLMLQQDEPEDFVISTGITTKVRDFIIMAFGEVGVQIEFKGIGVDEVGIVTAFSNTEYAFKVGQKVIQIDPNYFRPTEVDLLIGDNTKAKTKLGWQPKYTLPMIIKEMVQADIELFKKEKYLLNYNK